MKKFDAIKNLKEEYSSQYIDILKEGYQPRATGKPEGQNPPKGGSNVMRPPQSMDNKKK